MGAAINVRHFFLLKEEIKIETPDCFFKARNGFLGTPSDIMKTKIVWSCTVQGVLKKLFKLCFVSSFNLLSFLYSFALSEPNLEL
jgi:hypothetical protein